ncbi:MAG: protoglobin domain-containing protein [Methylohalobius sp.]|nr:protoglobin domain-containing protein [Methylohalobius sp.]
MSAILFSKNAERSLADLVELSGFSEQDAKLLASYYLTTSQWTEEIVQTFYEALFAYEPTAKVFQDGERAAREQTLRDWYHEVASGRIDSDFWRKQWMVGLVHIKRQVSNAFMLGMMSKVQQVFLSKCFQELPLAEAVALYMAFKRVTDVVAGLIAEGYFENYFIALERTVGFKRSLVARMLELEINKMLHEARG